MSGEPVGEFGPLASALLDAATAVARVERLDVAAGVGVTGPTMTSTVRILLRKGLAERRHEEVDWRTVLVSITDLGRVALTAAGAQRVALISGAMQALSV